MNTLEQRKLSESLLAACKAAGIEKPKYFAQDANGNVFHYSQSKPKPQKHCEEWDSLDRFFKQVNHPPYADDWQESLLEFREYALIRTCDKCQAITAIDMVGSDENEKELQCEGETVFRVSKEEAHGAVIKLCKCDCGVENFNITKAAAMAKWCESFGFTETEKQQIEDYAVAENEPLADVLARHPESNKWCITIETEHDKDGEPVAYFIRDHKGDIVQMIRPDHIADSSKMVDACDIAYHKMNDEYAGRRTFETVYRRAWSDALAWKAMTEKGEVKL